MEISEEIVNALFGYGSFSPEDVKLTSDALKYFGYGVPAFALVKILSNFFFARDNTKTPFYISVGIVTVNVAISVSLFSYFGFIIYLRLQKKYTYIYGFNLQMIIRVLERLEKIYNLINRYFAIEDFA